MEPTPARQSRSSRLIVDPLGGLGSRMLIEIGHVEAIFRYPVKSMGGERLEVAKLGWHGLDGDRRLAFQRMDDRSGFPWLTASKLPDLLLFAPHRREDGAPGDLPTHIRTPDGEEMPVFGEDLATEVGRRYGAPVQMMQLNHGIFDEASISVIAFDTVREIGRHAGRSPTVLVRRDLDEQDQRREPEHDAAESSARENASSGRPRSACAFAGERVMG